jgi:polar amino acid transport system substrate-binding protein
MPVPEIVPPDESILRVGVSTDAPPLISKQGGEVVGVEAELAREFAKFLGKSVRFIEIQWEEQIPALLDNRTDIIMSGMSVTKARQFRIAFSEPYFKTGLITLVRKADKYLFPPGYHGIYAQAIIRRIGIVKDTTGEFFVRKNYGAAKKISSFPTAKEAVEALKKKQIDLLIFDAPMVYVLAAENEWDLAPLPTFLTEEYLAWGIRKNDVELLESANSFVETLRKDGRLTTIIKRWIPITE